MFRKHNLPFIFERPAYVAYYDSYKLDDCIKITKDEIIIILKKEGKKMDAISLVNEELRKLEIEKSNVVAEILTKEKEKIEALKAEAARKAEEEFIESVKLKVNDTYKVAEDHLNSILAQLPKEVVTEEVMTEETKEEII